MSLEEEGPSFHIYSDMDGVLHYSSPTQNKMKTIVAILQIDCREWIAI